MFPLYQKEKGTKNKPSSFYRDSGYHGPKEKIKRDSTGLPEFIQTTRLDILSIPIRTTHHVKKL